MQEDWDKYKVEQAEDDFSAFIVDKKKDTTSPVGNGGIVSTPEQEFLTQEAMEERAGIEPRVSETLSFQEEQKPTEDYMGLFDKKDKVKKADESGVSLSFAEQVGEAASKAERPVEYIAKVNHIRKRLDYLKDNFTEAYAELLPIHKQLLKADSRTIDDIEKQLEFVESRIGSGQRMETLEGIVNTPEWEEYRSNVLKDPTRIAVQRLQDDNEKLRKAASLPKTGDKVEEDIASQYSDEELELFDRFDKDPRALQGASEQDRDKYVAFKGDIAEGKTPQDIINARKAILKGTGAGLRGYAEGYTMLLDDMKKSRAVTTLLEKASKIEQGQDVEFTTDDKLLMRALAENSKLHEELDKEIPKGYKIGESIGQSIGFMIEFIPSGAGAGAVGKQVLKGAAKLGAKKAVGKFGVGMAVKLAQAGIQTAKMPTFYKKTAENVSNGMNFGEAVLYSYWETGAEVSSEMIFKKNPVSGGAGNATNKIMQRMGINFNVDKGMVGVLKNTLEEAAEEKVGEIMTAPKDYESFGEFWQGFTDREQNSIMLGSVGLMTGTMGSVAVAGNSIAETKRKGKIKRLEKFVPSDLRAEIDIIMENTDLSVQQQYDLVAEAISDRIESQELGDDPATTAGNAMSYANYKIQGKASEATDKNAVVRDGELTIGEVEEVGTMQDQLDYLNEKGVDANGLNGEQVKKLYEKTKAEEDKAAIDEAVGEEAVTPTDKKEAETVEKKEVVEEKPSQKEETFATKTNNLKEKEDERQVQEERVQERQGISESKVETTERGEETPTTSTEEEKVDEAVGVSVTNEGVETLDLKSGVNNLSIKENGKVVGNIIVQRENGVNTVGFIEVGEDSRRKGFASKAYDVLASEIKLKYGEILKSGETRTEESEEVWKSLEEQGKAKLITTDGGDTYYEYLPTEVPQKPTEAKTEQKGAITPPIDKEAEKRLKIDEENKIEKATGIEPKNLRDVYKAGREVFGLNRSQALAQAIITDRIIGKISKRTGKSKSRVYGDIDYRKGKDAEFIDRVLKTNNVKFINDALSKAKGAQMPLVGSRVAVYALTDPNVSTPLHEMAHVYEKYMTKTEKDAVLKWTKQKTWNTSTSEAFARGFEKYLAEGVAPNKALEGAFKRFKEWLTDIYNGIVGSEIDIELNDEMVRVYNSMLGEGTVRPKKTKKVEYKKEFKDVDDLLFQAPQTDAFKNWFGESKAVDSNNNPLILLHGSPLGGIREFKIDNKTVQSSGLRELGTFFTTNLKMAEEYKNKKELSQEAKSDIRVKIVRLESQQNEVRNNRDFDRLEKEIQKEKSKLEGNIYPVFLSIQNPFVIDAKGRTWYDARQDVSVDIGYKTAYGIDAIEALAGKNSAAPNLGYDGIIFKNVLELTTSEPDRFKDYVGDTYMVFKPTQIKSAHGNKGTFDVNNPNIYFQSPIDSDVSERHTKAINNLIDNFEKEGVDNMEQSVRDYLEERGNPVSQSIVDSVLKNRGYGAANTMSNIRQIARKNPTSLLKMLDSIGVTIRKC